MVEVREEGFAMHPILRALVHLAQDLIDPLVLPVLDFCNAEAMILGGRITDPDPVGSAPFLPDPDPTLLL